MSNQKSRMFKDGSGQTTETLNPMTGCKHNCLYCWARDMAFRLSAMGQKHYQKHGFDPAINETVLKKPIKGKNKTYSISLMGDLFAKSVPEEWISRVLYWCADADSSNTFLFCTKNPERYLLLNKNYAMRDNFHYGVTIESDNDVLGNKYSSALPMTKRLIAFERFNAMHKFVSIEPVLKNNVSVFSKLILNCRPEYVYLGYDTKDKIALFDEPTDNEFEDLYWALRELRIEVRLKETRGLF